MATSQVLSGYTRPPGFSISQSSPTTPPPKTLQPTRIRRKIMTPLLRLQLLIPLERAQTQLWTQQVPLHLRRAVRRIRHRPQWRVAGRAAGGKIEAGRVLRTVLQTQASMRGRARKNLDSMRSKDPHTGKWVLKPPGWAPSKSQMVEGAAALGTGYVIYRVVRMLPSLAPPLWWTIPENLAIP